MAIGSGGFVWKCGLVVVSLLSVTSSAVAQPIIAAPDGTATVVTPQGDRFDISGGSLSADKANLFHSFTQFGLSEGQVANFLTNPNIRNILGRINGGDPSFINGLIQVTGGNSNLFLMNPAGLIFGPSASLNVPGSFTVTTATGIGFGNNWFNAIGSNNWATLVGTPNQFIFTNPQPGSIVNAGNLAVPIGANLSLIGGTIVNTGQLSAPQGTILIDAVPGESLIRISQEGHLLSLDVQPMGNGEGISGNWTQPVLSLPQLLTGKGAESAVGIAVNANGEITLTGQSVATKTGDAIASGKIDVSGETGGQVFVLGSRVGILGANINAAGTNGGGTILMGGDYQGMGTVPNALNTFVSQDSLINANALVNGNGGRVIVWADETTRFFGSITARGGASGGDGGFTEVSGKNYLDYQGIVDLRSPFGIAGKLLLDPTDITITTTDTGGSFGGGVFTPSAATSQIANTTLQTQLASSNVTISTASGFANLGDITVSAPVTWANSNSLTLQANNNITVSQPITNSGNGAIALNAGNAITVNANLTTRGGDISLSSTQDINTSAASLNSFSSTGNGGAISLSTTGGGNIITTGLFSYSIGSGTGGNITLSVTGGTGSINTAGNLSSYSSAGNGGAISLSTAGGGNIVTNGFVNSRSTLGAGTGGNITLSVNGGTGSITSNQGLSSYSYTGDGGSISLSTVGGNITTAGLNSSGSFSSGAGTGGNITLSVTGGTGSINTTNGYTWAKSAAGNGGTIALSTTGGNIITGDLWSSSDGTGIGGNITLNAGPGNITLNSDLNASATTGSGGNINILSSIILTQPTTTLTTSGTVGSGNVTFNNTVNGTIAGSQNLIVNAGAGSIAFNGAVGNAIALGNLTANSTGTTLFNDVNISNLTIASTSPIQIQGNITTIGNQTYPNAVTIANNSTLTGNGITFNSTLDGNSNLTLNSGAGNITFSGVVGATTPLGNLATNSTGTTIFNRVNAASVITNAGGTTQLNGNVTTTGSQTYNDTVTITNNSILTGNGIIFSNTVDGNSDLTVNSGSGNILFGGAVGATTPLVNLATNSTGTTTFNSVNVASVTTDAGGNTQLNGNVTTTGSQTYNDAVIIANNPILTGNGVAFNNTVDGNSNLTVNLGSGNILFAGTVGTTTSLGNVTANSTGTTTFNTVNAASVTTNAGGTTQLNGNVMTTGNQTYNDTVIIANNPILTGNGVAFNNTVDGNSNLTVNSGSGNVLFGGAVGGTTPLGDLTANSTGTTTFNAVNAASVTTNVGGTTQLNANVTTTGSQTYNDAVTIANNPLLSGNGITFGNTVDGNSDLTVNSGAGNILFGGAIGATTYLGNLTANSTGTTTFNTVNAASVTTNAGGTTQLNGSVTTTGSQTYNDAVTIANNPILTGNGVAFNNTVDGNSNLTVNSGSGNILFAGAVGTTTSLGNVTANSTGTTTFNTVNAASVTTNAGGTTQLNSNVTTTGNQTYNDTVILANNPILTGNSVTFNNTVDGNSNLTVNSGSGNVLFGGAVGGTTPLGDLTANSTGTTIFNAVNAASVTTNVGGTTQLNANVTTTGSQTYNDAVTIANTPLLSGNGITFSNTVDGNSDLTVNSGAGNILFGGAIGATTSLENLTANSTGTTTFNTVNAASVTTDAGGTTQLNGSVTTTGNQTYNDTVIIANNPLLTGNGITFSNTVDGNSNLTVNSGAGNVLFGGAVGATTPLGNLTANSTGTTIFNTVNAASVTTNAGGTTQLNGNVTTTGSQTYNDTVIIANNPVLNGNGVTFNNTLDGNSNLTVNSGSGNILFGGVVGAITPLADLTANSTGTTTFHTVNAASITTDVGGTTQLNANVTTTGSQTYNDAVTIANNPLLTGNSVIFNNTLDGNSNLTVNSGAGNILFGGAVGATTPLGNLTANSTGTTTFNTVNAASVTTDVGGTTQLNANVTTTGSQTYNDTVIIANNPVLNGNGVSFNNTLNGNSDLTVNSGPGNILFGGAVGTTTSLGNLTANSTGTTTFNTVNATSVTTDVGGTTQLNANVTTTGSQTYNDTVIIANNPILIGNGVTFNNTVDGNSNLTVSSSAGNILFGGAIGGTTPLINLATNSPGTTTFNAVNATNLSIAPGGTTQLNGNVTTTDNQTYPNPVTIANNPILTGNGITFNSTVDGNSDLTLNSGTGNLTFETAIGSITPLGNLVANNTGTTLFNTVNAASVTTNAGGITQLNANVTTTGSQTYNDTVIIANNPILTGTGITFNNTLDGNSDLTVNSGAGNILFGGAIGGTTPLGNLTANSTGTTTFNAVTAASVTTNVGGTTQLNGNVTTTGSQTYNDAVTLANNPVLTGNNITFSNTVDGNSDLTVNAGSGNILFGGAVGGTTPLGNLNVNSTGITTFNAVTATSITTNVGGTTQLNGNVTTTGPQTYNDTVIIANNPVLTGNGVTFNNTLDGNSNLTVNSSNGNILFGGTIGGTTPLGNLTTNTTATTIFNTVNATSVTTNVGGTTQLNANVTTTGSQTYNDAVTIANDPVLMGNGVTFINTVNGASNLTVNTGTGDVFFGSTIGAIKPLGDIIVNSAGKTNFDAVNAASVTTNTGGTTQLNGNVYTTGDQIYSDAVIVANNPILKGNNISFNSTVDGDSNLTVNSGVGAITFAGPIGGNTSLGNLTANTAGTTTFNTVNAASVATYGGGTTQLNGNVTTTGPQTYADAVTIANNPVLTGSQITFNNSLDGDSNLRIEAGQGDILFEGPIGANIPLGSLIANTTGKTIFNTIRVRSLTTDRGSLVQLNGNVTTTGSQFYPNAIIISNNPVLTGDGIIFNSTVDGNSNLTLNAGAGNIIFREAVGAITPLGNLIANSTGTTLFNKTVAATNLTTDAGGTTQLNGNVTTTENQTYFDPVTIANNPILSGNNITFNSLLDGNSDLTLSALRGNIIFRDAVGSLTPLHNLLVTNVNDFQVDRAMNVTSLVQLFGSGTTTFNGPVTTSGENGINLTGTNFNFNAPVETMGGSLVIDNAGSLQISTSAPLKLDNGLTQRGTGPVTLGADITANDRDIQFNSPVTVIAPVKLTSGDATIAFGSSLDIGNNLLTLTASEIDFLGSVLGSGSLVLQPALLGQNIVLGALDNSTSALDLTASDLQTIQPGLTALTIGRLDSNGNVKIANPLTFNNPVTIQTGTGAIEIDNLLTGKGNASISLKASTINLNSGINTAEGNLAIAGNINLGTNVTLNSRGNISLGNTINGPYSLTLTGETLQLQGDIGTLIPLTRLEVNASSTTLGSNVASSGDIVFNSAVLLTSDTRLATTSGNIIFSSTLDSQVGNPNLNLATSRDIRLGGAVGAKGQLGNLIIENAENVTAASTLNAIALQSNSAGSVNLQGNVTARRVAIATGGDLSVANMRVKGGPVSLTSRSGNLTTGNLNTAAASNQGGDISLNSRTGAIVTGDLNASGLSGGSISLTARTSITAGQINSSGSSRSSGNVFLDPIGDIQVEWINAQGGAEGSGGRVDIVAGNSFRATGSFIDQKGTNASISTVGGIGGGAVTIQHGGGTTRPFTIGNGTINGTQGAIASGEATLSPFLEIPVPPDTYTRGSIRIVTSAPIAAPTPAPSPASVPAPIPIELSESSELLPPIDFRQVPPQSTPSQSPEITSTIPSSSPDSQLSLLDRSTTNNLDRILMGDRPRTNTELSRRSKDTHTNPDDLVFRTVSYADISRLLERGEIAKAVELIDALYTEEVETYTKTKTHHKVKLFREIQEKLQAIGHATGTTPAVIYVFLGQKGEKQLDSTQLDLVLVSPTGLPIHKAVPVVGGKGLLDLSSKLREKIIKQSNNLSDAKQLYQWLIAPLEADLQARKIDTLVFAMGAELRSLPIAALHDGKQFLVEKYPVGLIPSINLVDTSYQSIQDATVLAMGASDFTGKQHSPLPGVPLELAAITQQWTGESFLNDRFTFEQLKNQREAKGFRIVHLATHATFRSGPPSNSYIQLWDRKLSILELGALRWYKPPVELLVLSACQTALGDRDNELGLAGVAVQAGVKSAVASLWGVNDLGTLALMADFYHHLKTAPTKAKALQQAQIAMLKGQIRIEKGHLILSDVGVNIPLPPQLVNQNDLIFSHPYYWAGFTLIGNQW